MLFCWAGPIPLLICECWIKRYFTHFHSILLSYFSLKVTTPSCKQNAKIKTEVYEVYTPKFSDNLGQNKWNKHRNLMNFFSHTPCSPWTQCWFWKNFFSKNEPDFNIEIKGRGGWNCKSCKFLLCSNIFCPGL